MNSMSSVQLAQAERFDDSRLSTAGLGAGLVRVSTKSYTGVTRKLAPDLMALLAEAEAL